MTFKIRHLLLSFVLVFFVASTSLAQSRDQEEASHYQVVVNKEKQYSIRLAGEEAPRGWTKFGEPCALEACHSAIEEVWTDMRPLSLRNSMKRDKLESRDTGYAVVINHEEQYSIWPTGRQVPRGWRSVDFQGSQEQCMNYIEEVWTDMRPLSLRKRLAKRAR